MRPCDRHQTGSLRPPPARRFSRKLREPEFKAKSPVSDLSQADDCLIHTGSKEILDGICLQLHLDTDSMKVNKSYAVLENYGNLSSASTGFMLAGKKESADPAMVVGFGVGFTARLPRRPGLTARECVDG